MGNQPGRVIYRSLHLLKVAADGLAINPVASFTGRVIYASNVVFAVYDRSKDAHCYRAFAETFGDT